MDDGTRDSLLLLAPGLLHHLGNALFAAHGRAQLLGTGDLQADRAAICEALDRAGAGLHVLRWTLGDESLGAVGVWQVLSRLQEALRVSLREHGLRLELRGEAVAASGTAPAAALVRSVLATVRELLHGAPGGLHGVAVAEVTGCSPQQLELRLRLQPEPGGLPFPVDLPRCAERLQPVLQREQADVIADGGWLRLLLHRPPGTAPSFA